MTHSSGLGGLSDTVHVKKMPHIPKKVVGGFFRKLKISFLINESKLSLYFTLFKGVFKYLISMSIHNKLAYSRITQVTIRLIQKDNSH